MTYLHMNHVLHRDLAARNILVKDHNVIKIADFGLAKPSRNGYYIRRGKEGPLPLLYLPPEVTTESEKFSEKVIC